jgi:hypothetical protein
MDYPAAAAFSVLKLREVFESCLSTPFFGEDKPNDIAAAVQRPITNHKGSEIMKRNIRKVLSAVSPR